MLIDEKSFNLYKDFILFLKKLDKNTNYRYKDLQFVIYKQERLLKDFEYELELYRKLYKYITNGFKLSEYLYKALTPEDLTKLDNTLKEIEKYNLLLNKVLSSSLSSKEKDEIISLIKNLKFKEAEKKFNKKG